MNLFQSSESLTRISLRLLVVPFLIGLPTFCAPGDRVQAEDVMLEFTYGSEKQGWITLVTKEYNAAGHTVNGKRVQVNPVPMGSGEAIEELISGKRNAHLISPASGAFI